MSVQNQKTQKATQSNLQVGGTINLTTNAIVKSTKCSKQKNKFWRNSLCTYQKIYIKFYKIKETNKFPI